MYNTYQPAVLAVHSYLLEIRDVDTLVTTSCATDLTQRQHQPYYSLFLADEYSYTEQLIIITRQSMRQ